MSLLFTQPISPVNLTKSDLRLWVKNEDDALAYVLEFFYFCIFIFEISFLFSSFFILQSKFDEALEKLSKLSIMTIDHSGYIQMNNSFRERFQDCLTGG